MLGDRWDVGGNLAQARQGQLERGQAIEQILAKTLGRHILPQIISITIVWGTLAFATTVLVESSLSFLGVGVPPPEPAWGLMLAEGRSTLMVGMWWLTIAPGVCIMLVVLATQLLGDWLRIRLDPQLRNL